MSKRKPAKAVWVYENHNIGMLDIGYFKAHVLRHPMRKNRTLTRYVPHDAKRERLIRELVKAAEMHPIGHGWLMEAVHALANHELERKKR